MVHGKCSRLAREADFLRSHVLHGECDKAQKTSVALPGRVAQLLGASPAYQKVAGSIPVGAQRGGDRLVSRSR